VSGFVARKGAAHSTGRVIGPQNFVYVDCSPSTGWDVHSTFTTNQFSKFQKFQKFLKVFSQSYYRQNLTQINILLRLLDRASSW